MIYSSLYITAYFVIHKFQGLPSLSLILLLPIVCLHAKHQTHMGNVYKRKQVKTTHRDTDL